MSGELDREQEVFMTCPYCRKRLVKRGPSAELLARIAKLKGIIERYQNKRLLSTVAKEREARKRSVPACSMPEFGSWLNKDGSVKEVYKSLVIECAR